MTNEQEIQKTEKTVGLLKRLGKGTQIAVTGAKITLAALVGGTAVHVYHQFHKSPEEITKETEIKKKETKEVVEQAIQKDLGTNDIAKAVSKVGGKIAETGASHGGAIRAWIAKKLQKED